MKDAQKNVLGMEVCFGCGVCAALCPCKAIDIRLNEDGFYVPLPSANRCIECGLCLEVCAYKNGPVNAQAKPTSAHAAWSCNDKIRQKASSGGLSPELALNLASRGYKLAMCVYDLEKNRVEHRILPPENIEESLGSKYLQSYTPEAFSKFKSKGEFAVFGTPCQISSLRRAAKKLHRENDFFLVEIFCHGVPTMNMWKKYCVRAERIAGKLKTLLWREKSTQWHGSQKISATGEKGLSKETFKKRDGNVFYCMYFSSSCMNEACYHCPFKPYASDADIRIGDFWGKRFADDKKGVSAVFIYTKKGEEAFSSLANSIEKMEVEAEEIMDGQLRKPKRKSPLFPLVTRLLKSKVPIEPIAALVINFGRIKRLKSTLKKKLKKFLP